MQYKNLAPSTIKTDLSAIRFWHDQIAQAKYILPGNDEFDLERRKYSNFDRSWNEGEIRKMMGACLAAGREDYARCIIIGRYAGFRIHEVMRLDTAIARATLKNGYIMIKGKNGKDRKVPLHIFVKSVFEEKLKTTAPGHKLFVPKNTLTRDVIEDLQEFIRKNRDKIREKHTNVNITFHGLRHTYAAERFLHFMSNGKSQHQARLAVSELLGHERAEITNTYLGGIRNDKPDDYWETFKTIS